MSCAPATAGRSDMRRKIQMTLCLALALPLLCVPARAVELEITRLDGSLVRGRLIQVMPEIVLAGAAEEYASTWSEILALEPLAMAQPESAPEPAGPLRFELADGSTFTGSLASAVQGGFLVRFQGTQTCRLNSTVLRSIQATAASGVALTRLHELATESDRPEDVAIVERDSRVAVLRGAVREIDEQRVLFAWKDRQLPLPWERLAGLTFANPLPRSAACTVRLSDGDVFAGRVTAGDESGITLQSAVFDGLELPWSQIERIECRSQRVTYLSDLTPASYEFTPFFQKQWDYAVDCTLTRRPIQLAGQTHAKGVSMHSRSTLTYTLDGRCRQFAALAGIADEMADRGDVTLAILGDGRPLWEARNVRGGQEPRKVLVDITGVRELSLHVDFGEGLDLFDHVCWAEARLIR